MPSFSEYSSSFQTLWSWISQAPSQRRHPLKTPTIITARDNIPSARTMVLRDTLPNTLIFFSDIRSAKIRDVQNNPNGSIHCYDPRRKLQFRFQVQFSIVQKHPKLERWRSLGLLRFEDYGSNSPPGSPIAIPETSPASLEIAQENFCVLQSQLSKIDLLKLSRTGHQRVEWQYLSSSWELRYLVP